MIDHRQILAVRFVNQRLQTRLVPAAPVAWREEQVFLVSDVAPDHDAVEQAVRSLDLRLEHLEGKLVGPLDEAAHLVRVEPDPQQEAVSYKHMPLPTNRE